MANGEPTGWAARPGPRRQIDSNRETAMRIPVPYGRLVLVILAGALVVTGRAAAQAPAAQFPDVPPWHWAYQGLASDARAGLLVGYPAAPAELVVNAVTQVYNGFAHAHAPGAPAWVERFTFNRPADWPGPLERSQVIGVSVRDVKPRIAGDAATATFTAQVTMGTGQTTATPMRINLRLIDRDWKIDYATLAGGSALFR